jgi:hypothetical protein
MVQGSGFGACRNFVSVSWSTGIGSKNDVSLDDKGNFTTDLTVPKNAKPGQLAVQVFDGCVTVTKKFTAIAPLPSPPPPPVTPPPQPIPRPTTAPLPSLSPSPSPTPMASPLPDDFAKNDYIDQYGTIPGKLIENMPKQMRVDETELIEARITRNLSDEIYKNLQGQGRPTPHDLPITADMKVEMIADPSEFDIRPMSSSIQSVAGSYAEWRWDVTPISSGIHKLTIRATLTKNQGQTFKDLGFYDYPVEVTVNPMYLTTKWLAGNWDKLSAVLGITVAGVFATLYQRLRRRLNKSSNRRTTGGQNPDE